MTKSSRTEKLEALVWVTLALAVVPNTVSAFDADALEGVAWSSVRAALSTLFVLALVAFLVSRRSDQRR